LSYRSTSWLVDFDRNCYNQNILA